MTITATSWSVSSCSVMPWTSTTSISPVQYSSNFERLEAESRRAAGSSRPQAVDRDRWVKHCHRPPEHHLTVADTQPANDLPAFARRLASTSDTHAVSSPNAVSQTSSGAAFCASNPPTSAPGSIRSAPPFGRFGQSGPMMTSRRPVASTRRSRGHTERDCASRPQGRPHGLRLGGRGGGTSRSAW